MVTTDYLVLADAATAAEGKHYIHGAGWDTIYTASLPVTHPALAVAIRLRISWTDTNQPCNLELDVIDADGVSILPNPPGPLRGSFTAGRPPQIPIGSDQVACLAFTLSGLQIPRQGTYEVILRLNGVDADRSPFNVMPLPGAPMLPT